MLSSNNQRQVEVDDRPDALCSGSYCRRASLGERAPEAPPVIATGARQGPLKRVELQLDAEDRVISSKIIYRKKSKIRRESEPD